MESVLVVLIKLTDIEALFNFLGQRVELFDIGKESIFVKAVDILKL